MATGAETGDEPFSIDSPRAAADRAAALGGPGSTAVVPQATYDTTLTHDLHPVQFAGLLTVLGLLWFTIPGEYHWMLSLALILGALMYANDVADKEGRLKPLDLFSSLLTGKGL